MTVLWATQEITGLDTTVICWPAPASYSCRSSASSIGATPIRAFPGRSCWLRRRDLARRYPDADWRGGVARQHGVPRARAARSIDAGRRRCGYAHRASPAPDLCRHDSDGDGAAPHHTRAGGDGWREPGRSGVAGRHDHRRLPIAHVLQHVAEHYRVRHRRAAGRRLPSRRPRPLHPGLPALRRLAATYWRWLGLF